MMSGVVFGLAAGLAPGPLLALVLAQSVRYGAMEGSKVAVAPLITDPPLIALSVLVFTSLASTDIVVGVVALTGAALLAYLAFDSVTVSEADRSHGIGAGSVWKGVSANLLNPHPYLFWIAVGAPTLVKASAVGRVAVLAFLAGMYGSLVGVKILVAVAAGRGSVILSNRLYVYMVRMLGLALGLFAVLFLREGLAYLM